MKPPLPIDIFVPQAGAYLVGGSVRDLLLNRRPTDYDITLSGDARGYAQQLATKLAGRLVVIGKRDFPLYRVVKSHLVLDVTPLKGGEIVSDLADRDFTINALACELTDGNLIDPFGGMADMEAGVVRMVSPLAFKNDPVRLIRAHRMAATLGFGIEPATVEAIAFHASAIQRSAGERIWTELALILSHTDSFDHLQQMASNGLLMALFPELIPLKGCQQSKPHHLDVFDHTLLAYHALETILAHPDNKLSKRAVAHIAQLPENGKMLLKLSLLLHDIGKPSCRTIDAAGKRHFYGHADCSVDLARSVCARLRLSNHESGWVEKIIHEHPRPLSLFQSQKNKPLSAKALGKFLRQCGKVTPHLILHAMADNIGKQPEHHPSARMTFFNGLMDAYLDTLAQRDVAPLLSGKDLMAVFNLTPSPLLGSLLRGIEEARLAGSISHRRQALDWAETYLKSKECSDR